MMGGDCEGRPLVVGNSEDGGKSVACIPDSACSSWDHSPCPQGTVCHPLMGGMVCVLPGQKGLGESCAAFTSSDVENGCRCPLKCHPVSGGDPTSGICRQGCDCYVGGPCENPCPSGFDCLDSVDVEGSDGRRSYCCPEGSGC